MEINCIVVCSESSESQCKLILSVKKEDTVKDVKEIIYKRLGIQSSRQQLKFEEQLMENERKLSDYSIQGGSTLQLMVIKNPDDDTCYEEEILRIQENFHKFSEVITEPVNFAAQLYSAKLITAEARDNAMNEHYPPCSRVIKLVSVVEAQIKAFPKENFRKFVKTLCKEECYQLLASSLHAELAEECIQEIKMEAEEMAKEKSLKAESVPATHSGSQKENISDVAEKEQKMGYEEMLEQKTEEVTPKSFAYSKSVEDTCEEKEQTCSAQLLTLEEVRIQVDEFEDRFSDLAYNLQEELSEMISDSKNKLKIGRVKQSITLLPDEIKSEYDRFLEKILDSNKKILKNCEDIEELFYCLNRYWSYFDYSLIEHLIKRHATSDLKQEMKKYAEDMKSFRQRTVVKTFAQVWQRRPNTLSQDDFTELKTKLKKDSAHCTLEEPDKLRKDFCAAYHLSESAVIVHKYKPGSVIIKWLLPAQFVRDLLSTIKREPIEVFCISRMIEYLYVGKQKVYSSQVFGEITVPGQYCLNRLLDERGSECLNGMDEHPYTHALVPGPLKYLQSDVDEQLIISFNFKKPIKLHSIHLSGPLDGRSPKTVKLFINHPQCLDFDQAESLAPVEELDLSEEDTDYHKDSSIPLKHIKGKNVSSLTVFIKDNQGGGNTTVVHHIGLFGSPTEACDVSQLEGGFGDAGGFSCKHETCPNS